MPKVPQNETTPEATVSEVTSQPKVSTELAEAPPYPGHWERSEKGKTYRLPDGSFIRHN